jgi:hypothetical protein
MRAGGELRSESNARWYSLCVREYKIPKGLNFVRKHKVLGVCNKIKVYRGHFLSLLFFQFELFKTLYFGTEGVCSGQPD